MKIFKLISFVAISLVILISDNGCSALKQVTNALTNIQRLQFKLANVDGFRLAGIGLNNKNEISDFSITDGLKLTQAFATKSFPAEFIVNVAAKNPNDGTGGSKQTTATLTGLDWQLYIDDVPTIRGNIDHSVDIPGTGQSTMIPLRMSLDLYSFFQNKGYNGIVNIALALGGMRSSPARLKLDAKPTVTTPFGEIQYPGRINIIDKQFN